MQSVNIVSSSYYGVNYLSLHWCSKASFLDIFGGIYSEVHAPRLRRRLFKVFLNDVQKVYASSTTER